jgi:hypothetical protein
VAQIKIYYEPEMELLTVFWQPPRKNQIATELGDGMILIKCQHFLSIHRVGETWSIAPNLFIL